MVYLQFKHVLTRFGYWSISFILVAFILCSVGCGGSAGTPSQPDRTDDLSGGVHFTGHVIDAASCSQEDVQAAIDQAQDGDIVQVPTGQCTWRTLSSRTPAVTISGKSIILQGAAIDSPRIILEIGGLYNEVGVSVDTGDLFTRVAGFTFESDIDSSQASIDIKADSLRWRVDHCHFIMHQRAIWANSHGVVDHCQFRKTQHGQGMAVLGGGDTAWEQPISLGTDQAVYVENCRFDFDDDYDGAQDAYHGARYVFRYNEVNNTHVGHHGLDSGARRSPHSFEIYGNFFSSDLATGQRALFFRGGTGVVFDNRWTGNYGAITVVNYRTCCGCGTENGCHDNCGDWGRCDGSNPLDGNEDATGYPCKDQIGRSTPPALSALQSLEPLYEWHNTLDGSDISIVVNDQGCINPSMFNHIQEGRDYHNNTARQGYLPLPFPHPLTLGDPDQTLLTVNATSTADQVTLQWHAVEGATVYRVRRDWEVLEEVTATQYQDSGLTAGAEHLYFIEAWDDASPVPLASEGSVVVVGQ